jgi:hypothetical protein
MTGTGLTGTRWENIAGNRIGQVPLEITRDTDHHGNIEIKANKEYHLWILLLEF